MSQNKFSQTQNQKSATTPPSTSSAQMNRSEIDFVPSPDEVARRAYFAYENNGSQPGHEVQHWLAAEAALIAERNRTRTHDFHHPTKK